LKAKRIIISAVTMGLLVWGLSELFHWILADLIGAGEVSRIAPGIAGAVMGITFSMLRQAIQKRKEEMLGEES
jgi:hypothetical protein